MRPIKLALNHPIGGASGVTGARTRACPCSGRSRSDW